MKFPIATIILAPLTLLCACALPIPQVPKESFSSDATLAPVTETETMLHKLPPAEQPIVVAVYEFSDYTGQNKPSDTQQFSRAVTQGGLPILKKALLDAGNQRWFDVVERGGINNLLQERKIIRTMREEYLGAGGRELPQLGPLRYAGLLLEGGVVAYESNVLTGGLGARYLGIGGNTQYSRDMVTVYLRAVSVKTGQVMLSVNTSKTIFSTALQGGMFKFVSYDAIAEAETGVTYNEPPQLAVRQAIEMAVYALIMEGTNHGMWKFKNRRVGQQYVMEYFRKYKPDAMEEMSVASNNDSGSSDPFNTRRYTDSSATGTPPGSSAPHRSTYADRSRQAGGANGSQQLSANSYRGNSRTSTPNHGYDSNSFEEAQTATSSYPNGQPASASSSQVASIPRGWYIDFGNVGSMNGGSAFEQALRERGLPIQSVVGSDLSSRILVGPYSSAQGANYTVKVFAPLLATSGRVPSLTEIR